MFTQKEQQSIRETAHKTGVPLEAAFRQAEDIKKHPYEFSPKKQAEYFKQQEEQAKRRKSETTDARQKFKEEEAFKKRQQGMDKVHSKYTVV